MGNTIRSTALRHITAAPHKHTYSIYIFSNNLLCCSVSVSVGCRFDGKPVTIHLCS